LALKVFQRTSAYDAAIAAFLNKEQTTQKTFSISLPLYADLRYGDNPHQAAALYGNFGDYFTKLHGKDLSYTNVIDIQSAAALVHEFRRPTVAILKHTNPCGVGCADEDLREAWDKAFETDKQAPFGGIIVANRTIDKGLAEAIAEIFSEVIIAPEFDADALAIFGKKKNLRLMRAKVGLRADTLREVRAVIGGVLVQDRDQKPANPRDFKVVTKRQPTADEMTALLFGWRVVRHVKSNAIVYAGKERTLSVGAGQMSRIDSSRIAVWKAGEAKLSLQGSAIASDAFFPFPDGLLAAADAGATCAIQPGGSVKDADVIAAADARGMAMVFTGMRHFKH
jgi:phosphoribosylaminoimidazolecarboxamide formyltransferase/IMP cyclohydrolase